MILRRREREQEQEQEQAELDVFCVFELKAKKFFLLFERAIYHHIAYQLRFGNANRQIGQSNIKEKEQRIKKKESGDAKMDLM